MKDLQKAIEIQEKIIKNQETMIKILKSELTNQTELANSFAALSLKTLQLSSAQVKPDLEALRLQLLRKS